MGCVKQVDLSMYSKTCVKRPLSKRQKIGFNTYYRLMQVKSIAECSKHSAILSIFIKLQYHPTLRSFLSILSGRFTQVLHYSVDFIFLSFGTLGFILEL